MRAYARIMFLPLILTATLAACGDKDKKETGVQMKDMEVVDGTATDAMTDLDGVQSEGVAVAMPGGNAANATAPAGEDAPPAKAEESEVLADQ